MLHLWVDYACTYLDFLLSPPVLRSASSVLNPYYFNLMHCSTERLISNKWIEERSDVQATICSDGWNTILVIVAVPEPRLRCCKVSPPSALKILITVPF